MSYLPDSYDAGLDVLGVAMPSLSAGTLRAPGDAPTETAAPLPAYAPSFSRPSAPAYAPTLSPGTLRAPSLSDYGPLPTASSGPTPTASSGPQAGFFARNVPGLNRPVWQVGLAGLGAMCVGVGVYMVVGGRR